MRPLFLALALTCATPVVADTMVDDILDHHILPRFSTLAETSQTLDTTAQNSCDPTSAPLRQAYHTAFDAWVAASHLRFGPTEVDDRAFALAFWPDSRGVTPRTLTGLITDQDPIGTDPVRYADVSIAARGFYALEFLLFDDALMRLGAPGYRCSLIQTIATDIAVTSAAIDADWRGHHADVLRNPGPDARYQNDQEVRRQLFGALITGLEFTAQSRLGRPLGSFDRPRPTRAEARRSGRSARHVVLSLTALHDLATRLGAGETIQTAFARAQTQIADLNDPVFAGVSDPATRIKVEIIQTSTDRIRSLALSDLGPDLGVAAGFNALDGD